MNKKKYYVYILLCANNSLYTGITTNLNRRFKAHKTGKGSKYVRANLPFKHIYTEEYPDRSIATKREIEIKSWERNEKIENLNLDLGRLLEN